MTDSKIVIHRKTFNVAWADMDALGHVNHVRYFDYFQEARINWLLSLGFDVTQTSGPILINCTCTFLQPVIYPATLLLENSLDNLGNTSFVVNHDLFKEEQPVAKGSCKIVWFDFNLNKAIPVPDIIRNLFHKN